METITEQLAFREAVYPQRKRLPKGMRFVKQSGTGLYCSFASNGSLITINSGASVKGAKQLALAEINRKYRLQNLIHGNQYQP